MNKIIFIMGMLFPCKGINAQQVTEQQALQKAKQFMQNKSLRLSKRNKGNGEQNLTLVQGLSTTNAFFAFNTNDNSGWVIVSGDERANDILAYSTEGNLDIENMPENAKAWLNGYESIIKTIPTSASVSQTEVANHPAISPMITAKWNQFDPYNLDCPIKSGQHCATGCVATSMAMIMYYHKWPQDYIGPFPGLPETIFDWDNMKDEYNSGERGKSVDAVAELMHYCGVSVDMNYSLASSGAEPYPKALIDFGYDKGTVGCLRSAYSASEWDELIYFEMQAGRPVWYTGEDQNSKNGHQFVCDGYDGNGLYHINWGWGGHLDGYFRLSCFGEGQTGYMSYCAIVGIQKPTDNVPINPFTKSIYTIISKSESEPFQSVVFDYRNMSSDIDCFHLGETKWIDGGVAIQQKGSNESVIKQLFEDEPVKLYYKYSLDVGDLELSEGTWDIYPVWRETGEEEWHSQNCINEYVEASVKSETMDVKIHPVVDVDTKIEYTGDYTANKEQTITINVKNLGDETSLCLLLYNSQCGGNKDNYYSYNSYRGLFLGREEQISYDFTFYAEEGPCKIWITDKLGNMLAQSEITFSDVSTSINNIKNNYSKKSKIYNLGGQRISNQSMNKLYIQKGKKMIER